MGSLARRTSRPAGRQKQAPAGSAPQRRALRAGCLAPHGRQPCALLPSCPHAGFVIDREAPFLAAVDLPTYNSQDPFEQTPLVDDLYDGGQDFLMSGWLEVLCGLRKVSCLFVLVSLQQAFACVFWSGEAVRCQAYRGWPAGAAPCLAAASSARLLRSPFAVWAASPHSCCLTLLLPSRPLLVLDGALPAFPMPAAPGGKYVTTGELARLRGLLSSAGTTEEEDRAALDSGDVTGEGQGEGGFQLCCLGFMIGESQGEGVVPAVLNSGDVTGEAGGWGALPALLNSGDVAGEGQGMGGFQLCWTLGVTGEAGGEEDRARLDSGDVTGEAGGWGALPGWGVARRAGLWIQVSLAGPRKMATRCH